MRPKNHYASKYFTEPARALPIPFKIIKKDALHHIRNVVWVKNFSTFKIVEVDYIRSDEDYDAKELIKETKES